MEHWKQLSEIFLFGNTKINDRKLIKNLIEIVGGEPFCFLILLQIVGVLWTEYYFVFF